MIYADATRADMMAIDAAADTLLYDAATLAYVVAITLRYVERVTLLPFGLPLPLLLLLKMLRCY